MSATIEVWGVDFEERTVTSRLNPYLSFNGNARDAMEFYQQVFGGTLTLSTFGEFTDAHPEHSDKIMHGMLETPTGFTLMGGDPPPGVKVSQGDNFTVAISGDDVAELHEYWDKLSANGQVITPMAKQMWGDEFGACTDRFGIPWLVNISQPS